MSRVGPRAMWPRNHAAWRRRIYPPFENLAGASLTLSKCVAGGFIYRLAPQDAWKAVLVSHPQGADMACGAAGASKCPPEASFSRLEVPKSVAPGRGSGGDTRAAGVSPLGG
eukprot:gene23331-biopygen4319